MNNFASERFLHLKQEKSDRVLAAAINEFATRGYEQANTNRIASTAGISVGALFKYFASKEDLFRYVIHAGSNVIEDLVGTSLAAEASTMEKIEQVLRIVVTTSSLEREYVLLYHEATSVGNKDLTHDLVLDIESFTARSYIDLMKQGQARGEVRTDLSAESLAFLLDNIFVTLQFSLACDYYQDRMKRYLDLGVDDLIDSSLAFIRSALEGPR